MFAAKAKRISFADPTKGGSSATAFEAIIKDLGVRDTIYAKGIVTPSSHGADPVSRGEAEYGVAPMGEALPLPGVEVTPFLPSDPRTRSTFLAGVGPKATDADGCRLSRLPDLRRRPVHQKAAGA
jgi:molybdate transport system substrate-binding protein